MVVGFRRSAGATAALVAALLTASSSAQDLNLPDLNALKKALETCVAAFETAAPTIESLEILKTSLARDVATYRARLAAPYEPPFGANEATAARARAFHRWQVDCAVLPDANRKTRDIMQELQRLQGVVAVCALFAEPHAKAMQTWRDIQNKLSSLTPNCASFYY
jgi:hypothetical protein